MGRRVWVLGVLVVLAVLAAAMPAMAAVVTQSNSVLSVSITQSEPIKTNDFNYVIIKLDPKTSYPVSARIVIKPSYFAISPDWVKGCDAHKTGSGVTCTLWNFQDDRTIKVVIPGAVVEDLKGKEISLIGGVEVYPFTSDAAAAYGVEAKNLQALSVAAPLAFVSYNNEFEAFFPVILILIGMTLAIVGAKYLR